ncbi:SDR family oxidoreductase [Dyadobacter frigoris]|uniref:SDR family NAD(P)-dependent oxidoreductase n=1 Tax=Dyadobacter frigoris TaxID=2576211 RepID=A0A4U6DFP1_9BACT|nr:SDR family NAD(P)-dependent oxidoreductase [Dyadobacter frigoris]TKT93404.1 SDR family NAD(P)-dependent oxidoreductase [Dyadobacter frigoris]GLU54717.1 oxidoreductase [Dyadobacter frigoris]
METLNNTILITGGGSGIGLEVAKKLSAPENKIIIVGRNLEKLISAASELENATVIRCDITIESEVDALVEQVKTSFPDLNILINNSGSAHQFSLDEHSNAYEGARKEMEINYLAPIRLTEKLLPVLKSQPEAAVVNVTSVVAIVPWAIMPTYSASKAALQSYTRLLRLSLAKSEVKVFEVLPPLVDTDFTKNIPTDKMAPAEVADAIIKGFKEDQFEIRIGFADHFYNVNKQSPEAAFNTLNGIS